MKKRGSSRKSKRSQSGVITIVILIVVVVAAIILVGNIIFSVIKKGSGDIHSDIFSVGLTSATKPIADSSQVMVKIHRSSGKGNISSIRFLLKDNSGRYYNHNLTTNLPNELETKTYNITYSSIGLASGTIVQVQFVPVFKDVSGKEYLGVLGPEIKLGAGINIACSNGEKRCNPFDTNVNQTCVNSLWSGTKNCSGFLKCSTGICINNVTCVDADNDGYNQSAGGCGLGDCDDSNADANPGASEICNNDVDENCDDFKCICDNDADGYDAYDGVNCFGGDCNDDNADVNPGVDNDADDYNVCEDCNDDNADVNPGATENCETDDDDNCDGDINENCGTECDGDSDGYDVYDDTDCLGNDCDDGNADVNPGATEYPGNGIDENCDGYDLMVYNIVSCQDIWASGYYSLQNSVSSTTDENCFNIYSNWVVLNLNGNTISSGGVSQGYGYTTSGVYIDYDLERIFIKNGYINDFNGHGIYIASNTQNIIVDGINERGSDDYSCIGIGLYASQSNEIKNSNFEKNYVGVWDQYWTSKLYENLRVCDTSWYNWYSDGSSNNEYRSITCDSSNAGGICSYNC